MKTSITINGNVRQWRRYPARKPVDLDWCREVPSHWSVAALKRFARFQSGDGITALEIEPEGEFPVFGGNGLRGYTSKYTHDGDFVLLGRQGALCGNVNYASGRFWASEHAVVATPSKTVCLRWYGELLRAMDLGRYSMSAAQPGLSVQFVVSLLAPIPPLDEQRRIVAFLDRETFKIDALIAKKERLVELLLEKRQAIGSHAVTKGLNRTVPMKESGIEWAGKIPAHWQVKRAKFLFRQSNLPVRDGEGVVTAFRDGQVTLRENRRTEGFTFAILEVGYQGIRKGQLVLHSMDAFAGAIGVSESDGKCSPEYIVCDPLAPDFFPEFYAPCLREMSRQRFIEVSCQAVRERAPRIRFSTFGEMWLPVPPREEQLAIAALIINSRQRYEEYIRTLRRSINMHREFHTALISAAITGKIDVREEIV